MMISYLSHTRTLHRDAYRRQFHVDRACLVCSFGVITSFCCGLWPELFAHLCLLYTCVHHPKGLLQLLLAAATLSSRGWHAAWTTAPCITDSCYSSKFSLLWIAVTAITNTIQVSCVARQPLMVLKCAARMTCIWNKKYHMCKIKPKETRQKKTFSLCSSYWGIKRVKNIWEHKQPLSKMQMFLQIGHKFKWYYTMGECCKVLSFHRLIYITGRTHSAWGGDADLYVIVLEKYRNICYSGRHP